MNDEGPSTPAARAEAAIMGVTSAYETVAAMIEALDDPDEAFRIATELWSALRAATDANGKLRARLAARIWTLHELDLAALGDRLSVGKTRAGQFMKSARAQQKGTQ
jgi:hypothetical protein